MKGEDESRRPAIVRTTLEALYAFMHLLAPVLPMAGQAGALQLMASVADCMIPQCSVDCMLYKTL